MYKWKFNKKLRYFFFRITCFMVDGLGFCIDEEEQEEFYERFHENDTIY